jgi:triphosphoribosyl-dephospho-CoA synthase
MKGLTPALIAGAYQAACLDELRALKPGNVHIYADGHRMSVRDFERSASVSAAPLAAAGERVGRRILGAVRETIACVGTNTNLGIVLLCAPLAAAAERRRDDPLAALPMILAELDRQDADDVFEAIRLASPAGLGEAAEHDVRTAPTVDLLTIMRAAADRDRIARAYASEYLDVSATGRPALEEARRAGLSPDWCTTAVYLAYLAAFPDTHILRKHGPTTAEQVRHEAEIVRAAWLSPGPAQGRLLEFDADLKARGLNPGTSADLTVATLFLDRLTALNAYCSALVC